MDKAKKGAKRALVDVAYVGLYTVITFLFVFFLWNWIVPVIFGLPKITALQAFGLTLLVDFLFKE